MSDHLLSESELDRLLMASSPYDSNPDSLDLLPPHPGQAVGATTRSRTVLVRPRSRWAWVAILVAGIAGGMGISAAAFASTGWFGAVPVHVEAEWPDLGDSIPAPAGVLPGEPVVSLLGSPTVATVLGHSEVALTDVPEGATHVRVTVVCMSSGLTTFGTDTNPSANPGIACSAGDVANTSGTTWTDIAILGSGGVLYVDTAPSGGASIALQYLNYLPTRFAVNANGETYGVDGGPLGSPDLVAVAGVSPNGDPIKGYARSADLNSFSPDHRDQPRSPEESVEWTKQRAQLFPEGWDIAIYSSDGTTRIGAFHIALPRET